MTITLRAEVESVRPARTEVDPWKANSAWIEQEPDGQGGMVNVLTILLTCAECPWRCAMCDLWKQTLSHPTPPGAIPVQIDRVLEQHGTSARWLKLYNSGSFFDRHSIPVCDYGAIAQRCKSFDRVIVENHPRLSTEQVVEFQHLLAGRFEIAMGVETLQTGLLRRLNKGMNRDDIDRAIALHSRLGIDTRAFVLIRPPYCGDDESVGWCLLTLRHLFARGVRHVSLIPTRAGNGWMEQRQLAGEFERPSLRTIEEIMLKSFELPQRGVVTVDLWDWGDASGLLERLKVMNLTQQLS